MTLVSQEYRLYAETVNEMNETLAMAVNISHIADSWIGRTRFQKSL